MKKRTCCFLLVFLSAALASAQIQITLKQQFVNDFADQVTIDSNFRVDVIPKFILPVRMATFMSPAPHLKPEC